MTDSIESRIDRLEQKVEQLDTDTKKKLNLYREVQIGDEETIRNLYNTVQALQRYIESILPPSD